MTEDIPAFRELEKCANNSSTDFLWCSMLLNSKSTDQYVLRTWWSMEILTNVRALGLCLVLLLLVRLDAVAVFDVV